MLWLLNAPKILNILNVTVLNDVTLDLQNKLIQVILVSLKLPLPVQYQTALVPPFNQPVVVQLVQFLYVIEL